MKAEIEFIAIVKVDGITIARHAGKPSEAYRKALDDAAMAEAGWLETTPE